jgi:hypothetical protein
MAFVQSVQVDIILIAKENVIKLMTVVKLLI